ncbi:hypothetical protein LB505_004951 [Fusarium chuoi]|nr:hypothetical protein LB505_004951 [Fusarium chuoi]
MVWLWRCHLPDQLQDSVTQLSTLDIWELYLLEAVLLHQKLSMTVGSSRRTPTVGKRPSISLHHCSGTALFIYQAHLLHLFLVARQDLPRFHMIIMCSTLSKGGSSVQ